MKTLIVYDSLYGNTEKVAKKIGEALHGKVLPVDDCEDKDLNGVDLLFVGSPTQAGRPTKKLTGFFNSHSFKNLQDIHAASFDTRFDPAACGTG